MFKTTSGRLLWLILGVIFALSLPLSAQDRGGRGSQGINGGDQSRIDFTDGSLATGAKPTGTQSLCLTGGVLTGCDVVASDAGLTSLTAADAAAGLPYTTAADTWSRVAAGTDLCPYFSSASAMTTASCVSYGRGLLGYASEALFKAGVNLEANTDFYAPGGTDVAVADGGTGSSTAAAAAVALNVRVAWTVPTTITATDTAACWDWQRYDGTGVGDWTITLPAVTGTSGCEICWKEIGGDAASTITVDGAGAETIDNSASFTLTAAYAENCVISDGSEWWRK